MQPPLAHKNRRMVQSQRQKNVFWYSLGLLHNRRLARILALSGYQLTLGLPFAQAEVLIWGKSAAARRGQKIARHFNAPLLYCEDAFLRSLFPARLSQEPPIGIMLDKRGFHYDPAQPSDLEQILQHAPLNVPQELQRAEDAIFRLQDQHLSKYSAFDPRLPLPEPGFILLIDQTRGDGAVRASGGGQVDFDAMLEHAKAHFPDHKIIIRTHPETRLNLREGYFSARHCDTPQITLFNCATSPWHLLERAKAVYSFSSQLGFEAILAGHRAHIFGQPFYAGWGLTVDHKPMPWRSRKLSSRQLFLAAMIKYPIWYDAYRDCLCSLETTLDNLEAEARTWREDHQGWSASGISLWKRRHFRAFFGRYKSVKFQTTSSEDLKGNSGKRMVWASAKQPAGKPVTRIEDGFLRSRGLGADLMPPLSLICDDLGIYYDPSQESRLERILLKMPPLRADQIRRIQTLQRRLIDHDLTKYNLHRAYNLQQKTSCILVPGQVADDASVLCGGGPKGDNLSLLKRVRNANPNAFILFKPHPDVESNLRLGALPKKTILRFADNCLENCGAAQALRSCDAVHTGTSLMGFEALLRGISVTTYGQPFYAGWGLTNDLGPRITRRKPGLTLLEFLYGCLILYPRYFDPVTRRAFPVEVVVDRLLDATAHRPSQANRVAAKLQGWFAKPNPFWR